MQNGVELDPEKNFYSSFIEIQENIEYECRIHDCRLEHQNEPVVRFTLVVRSPDNRVGFHYPFIKKIDEIDSQWYRFNLALFGREAVMTEMIERSDYIGIDFICTFKKLDARSGKKVVYPIYEIKTATGEMIRLIG